VGKSGDQWEVDVKTPDDNVIAGAIGDDVIGRCSRDIKSAESEVYVSRVGGSLVAEEVAGRDEV